LHEPEGAFAGDTVQLQHELGIALGGLRGPGLFGGGGGGGGHGCWGGVAQDAASWGPRWGGTRPSVGPPPHLATRCLSPLAPLDTCACFLMHSAAHCSLHCFLTQSHKHSSARTHARTLLHTIFHAHMHTHTHTHTLRQTHPRSASVRRSVVTWRAWRCGPPGGLCGPTRTRQPWLSSAVGGARGGGGGGRGGKSWGGGRGWGVRVAAWRMGHGAAALCTQTYVLQRTTRGHLHGVAVLRRLAFGPL
jgi:hypothetical protein